MKLKIVLLLVGFCIGFGTEGLSQNTNKPPAQDRKQFDLKNAGITPIGNWQVDPIETAELNQIYSQALTSANSIGLGPDADSQRHEVDNALREELEAFLVEHPKSAYAPALHESLARSAIMRCGYSLAIEHFRAAVDMLSGSADETAQLMELDTRICGTTGRVPLRINASAAKRGRAVAVHTLLEIRGLSKEARVRRRDTCVRRLVETVTKMPLWQTASLMQILAFGFPA